FKFADSVLAALGKGEKKSGGQLIESLTALTGVLAPRPLSGLDGREKRFSDCVAKENMDKAVLKFLQTM
ncbi:MAG: threonine synthase, partial [Oscillospiraceae bacterium]